MSNYQERTCAFTGLKATAKIRFPSEDPHSWIEVPCSHLYKNLRDYFPKLTRHEKTLVMYFYELELISAGLYKAENLAHDHRRMASYKNFNKLSVEYKSAKLQAEHDLQVEEDLNECLAERLKGIR